MSSIQPNRPERQIGPSYITDLDAPLVGDRGGGSTCDPGAMQDLRASARTTDRMPSGVFSAVALQSRLTGGGSMPKDYIPLEEWYEDMPPETRLMDDRIGQATEALDRLLGGNAAALGGAGGKELQEALRGLIQLLARSPDDLEALTRLADQADSRFLDYASGGDRAAREIMERQYGRSIGGGGAFGNALADRLGEDFALGPTRGAGGAPAGYDSLDAARGGAYVREGSTGSQVEALQRAMNAAGMEPPMAVDGRMSADMTAAIRRFQQENGCKVDGIVGPETLGALDRKLGLPPREPPAPSMGGGGMGRQMPLPGGGGMPAPIDPNAPPPGPPAPGVAGRVIASARGELGVREATGNNDGVPAQRYSFGQNEAWCANFVSWNFRQAGAQLPGNQDAIGSCDTMARELAKRGALFQKGQGTPQPGDIIFFGKPGDLTHVGIVQRVENGQVYTIEGNSGNRVAERSYPLDSPRIMSYGRWPVQGATSGA